MTFPVTPLKVRLSPGCTNEGKPLQTLPGDVQTYSHLCQTKNTAQIPVQPSYEHKIKI